jgi:hypothetical protein
VQLRVDGTAIHRASSTVLAAALRRLDLGEARLVELYATPSLGLVATRDARGRLLLELADEPAGKAPHYITCVTGPLLRVDLYQAFVLFHHGRLAELSSRFTWRASRPRPVQPERGGVGLFLWLLFSFLGPFIELMFHTSRH